MFWSTGHTSRRPRNRHTCLQASRLRDLERKCTRHARCENGGPVGNRNRLRRSWPLILLASPTLRDGERSSFIEADGCSSPERVTAFWRLFTYSARCYGACGRTLRKIIGMPYGRLVGSQWFALWALAWGLWLHGSPAQAQLVPLTEVLQVAAGGLHTCALTSSGA